MLKFKLKFIVIFLFVLSCNVPFGPNFYPDLSYLYVTSPGENNNWDIGSKQSISWAVQNHSFTSVKIELYKNDTLLTPPIDTQIIIIQIKQQIPAKYREIMIGYFDMNMVKVIITK